MPKISISQFIWLGIFVCALIVLFSWFTKQEIFFPLLPIKDNIDIVSIFSGMLIIVALIERTIELFIPFISQDPSKPENVDRKNQLIEKRRNTALILGLVAGFIASIIGIRILSNLIDLNNVDGPQKEIVILVDIIFSAIGISLGSQLFHIFPSLTSSVLGAVKEQSDENIESSKLRTADLKRERMPIELDNKKSEREIATIEREIANSRLDQLKTDRESLRIEQEMKSEDPTNSSLSENPIEAKEPE